VRSSASTPRSDLDLDFTEKQGFLVGRSAAMADWAFKKDNAGFEAMCARLYQRNWARKYRTAHPDRVRANLARWRQRHASTLRERDRVRRAAVRVPRIITCCVCQVQKRVRAIVTVAGRATKFCSKKCANQYHSAIRARARNRALRGDERPLHDAVEAFFARHPQ
jgi:hypothetical protein